VLDSPAIDRDRLEEGMGAQIASFAGALAAGMPRLGWKVGINVPAVQAHLGLAHPLVGWLDGRRCYRSGEVVTPPSGARLHVEPELCVALAAPVGADLSPAAALERVGGVCPALEIVDYAAGGSSLHDLLAHGMFHFGVVLGEWRDPALADGLGGALPELGVADGTPLVPTPGLVPGPIGEWLRFVAGYLETFGLSLDEGDVILSGSYSARAAPLAPGASVRADFGSLGRLELEAGG